MRFRRVKFDADKLYDLEDRLGQEVRFAGKDQAKIVADLLMQLKARITELEDAPKGMSDHWVEWLDRLRAAGLTDQQIDRVLSMVEALALIHAPDPREEAT